MGRRLFVSDNQHIRPAVVNRKHCNCGCCTFSVTWLFDPRHTVGQGQQQVKVSSRSAGPHTIWAILKCTLHIFPIPFQGSSSTVNKAASRDLTTSCVYGRLLLFPAGLVPWCFVGWKTDREQRLIHWCPVSGAVMLFSNGGTYMSMQSWMQGWTASSRHRSTISLRTSGHEKGASQHFQRTTLLQLFLHCYTCYSGWKLLKFWIVKKWQIERE